MKLTNNKGNAQKWEEGELLNKSYWENYKTYGNSLDPYFTPYNKYILDKANILT